MKTGLVISTFISLTVSVSPTFPLKAQCSTISATPSSFANLAYSGSDYAWNNPSNAGNSDNSRTTASVVLSVLSGKTDYLNGTGLGFNLSPEAVICGIEVNIEKSGTNLIALTSITDSEVRLLKNGIATSSNKATATNWSGSDTYYSYGGSSDLWGTTWSPAEVNASNFGVQFAAQLVGIVGTFPSARIDHISVTVYYLEVVLPILLEAFQAKATGTAVLLNWKPASPEETASYEVQHSRTGLNYSPLARFSSFAGQQSEKGYQYLHTNPAANNYYRLKLISKSGAVSVSPVRQVKLGGVQPIELWPNPAPGQIHLSGLPGGTSQLCITDITGRIVLQKRLLGPEEMVDIVKLPAGIYRLTVRASRGGFYWNKTLVRSKP